MAQDLLIEIGLEELPAQFIEPAMASLSKLIADQLTAERIDHGQSKTFGTPRRLTVLIEQVAAEGQSSREVITGPPTRAAYDGSGNPTKAAAGFAKSQGVSVADLTKVETTKGEYLAVEKELIGRTLAEVISESLPDILTKVHFPKRMRWGAGEFRFARPIHWIVILHGDEIIQAEAAGIASGRTTRGHRFNSPEPIDLDHTGDYAAKLRDAFVVIDPAERKEIVRRAATEAAEDKGGVLLTDEELVEINANLVEWPSAVCGSFDDKFLEVPDAVLITAMKEHQKYFAVVDDKGKLRPNFVAINNTAARDPEVVRAGHERVLRARLSDAAFFFAEDAKSTLESRLEEMKKVTYHRDLGTSYLKIERTVELTERLADKLAGQLTPGTKETAIKAAWLAKCDLLTGMVGEFPNLQGYMGQAYAEKERIDQAVAKAIGQHYLPDSAEAAPPESEAGALVSLADKMDTIAGLFAVGKPPTGAADPYALRRAALGVIRILIAKDWSPNLTEFIGWAMAGLTAQNDKQGNVRFKDENPEAKIAEFFRGRMLNLFTGQGHDHDVVEAVLEIAFDDPAGAVDRIKAVQSFKNSPNFEEGAVAFKRVFNILKGQTPTDRIDPALFEQDEEKTLNRRADELADRVAEAAGQGDFAAVLDSLISLKPDIDAFFDAVMVMAEDDKIRENRLALVNRVGTLFRLAADFSKLQTG